MKQKVLPARIELATFRLWDWRSTNWAKGAVMIHTSTTMYPSSHDRNAITFTIQTRPSSHDNDLIMCVSSTTSSTTSFTDSSTVIACSNERYFSIYAHGCYLEHCHDFNATPMLHTFQPYGRPLWWTTTLLIHRATSSVPNVGECDAKLESCTWPIVIYQAIYEPD